MKNDLSVLTVFSLGDYSNDTKGLEMAINDGAVEQMNTNANTIHIASEAAHMTAKKLGHTIGLATIVNGKHTILKY